MDINPKDLGHPHLHKIGQIGAAERPQPMANTVGLDRLIAFEEQDRLQEAVAGRVTVIYRNQIGAGGLPQIGGRDIGIIGNFAQNLL